MIKESKYHTTEENQVKVNAIDDAVRNLALNYIHGNLASHPEVLYHQLDNINALLTELRRG